VYNDIRGATIYIEDGNEMYNKVFHNVAICPWAFESVKRGCTLPGKIFSNIRIFLVFLEKIRGPIGPIFKPKIYSAKFAKIFRKFGRKPI
jgi:hypothetical protein